MIAATVLVCSHITMVIYLYHNVFSGHPVFYGVESWSRALEWSIGVEWSKIWSGKILVKPADSVYLKFSQIWTGLF